MKIAVTGLSGLVGSRLGELLSDKHDFIPIGLSVGVDITKKDSIIEAVSKSDAEIVVNMAGKADVDGSEKDKSLGEEGEAWKLNVLGAENIAIACANAGKKLIHISSDFVFDGEKDFYTEEDVPNPIDWYGRTKYEGEKAIQKVNGTYMIARIAYPYRASFKTDDFFRAMLSRLREGKPIAGIIDHIVVPTFIDDIAYALDILFEKGEKGIYHIVGDTPLSPYDIALLICDKFDLDRSLVTKTTREEFFKNRARRPFRLYLRNDKIQKLGAKMLGFPQGLDTIKQQI